MSPLEKWIEKQKTIKFVTSQAAINEIQMSRIDAIAIIEKLKAALEFYSKPILASKGKPGDRIEFGCGCCAGVINEKEENDYDNNIIGLTAREALATDPENLI